MSQENVEIMRRHWEAWEQGNLDAVFALYDPAVVWVSHTGPIEMRRTYVGHDGVRQSFREFLEPFENVENHAETFIDAGDSVIVGWQISGRGKTSEAPVSVYGWSIHTLRNGLLIRVDLFDTKNEALEAMGLSE